MKPRASQLINHDDDCHNNNNNNLLVFPYGWCYLNAEALNKNSKNESNYNSKQKEK